MQDSNNLSKMDRDLILPDNNNCTLAIIGLGYVGLPLAIEFSKIKVCPNSSQNINRKVIGFDINNERILELRSNLDRTNEFSSSQLISSAQIEYSSDKSLIKIADVFIITVPTPIDKYKKPDLSSIRKASELIGFTIKERFEKSSKSDTYTVPIIIYESTVFPGTTEDICVPIIEKFSGLKFNKDFVCGYSPERINPGDTKMKIADIVKLTSGSTTQSAKWIDKFYRTIIRAGTYLTPSIKVAEAAKVIENTQRDLNIALVNELSIIFRKLNINTLDVLDAAATKWNFLNFRPGLVGGHCIGVDPYYLTYKAEEMGYHPEVVLAGRRINDDMANWFVNQLVIEMAKRNIPIGGSSVLILGLSFKENCSDIRNTKVIDIIENVKEFNMNYLVVDPLVNIKDAENEYKIKIKNKLPKQDKFDAIIMAVAHEEYKNLDINSVKSLLKSTGVILDIKGILDRSIDDNSFIRF